LVSHGHQTGFDLSSEFWGILARVFVRGRPGADVGNGDRAGSASPNAETINRWFEQQTANMSASFNDARKKVEGFSNAAGDAAKTTVEGAKDAAGAVTRIPTRPVSGHEKCQLAPNGAPDCVAAANTMCKAKGFESGKSLDMTTAEVCPPKVYMSGRSTGPECTTETFVSRAICQ
jgi:hypothetical protein